MNLVTLNNRMTNIGLDSDYIKLCTSYAKKLNDNGFPVIFDFLHFSRLLGITPQELTYTINWIDCSYKVKYIKKKNGKNRKISIPSENLKYMQRYIVENILHKFSYSEHATGFTRNKSILDNAKKHINKECVINIDIKDFFPSIKFPRVYNAFKICGYTKKLCALFATICTFEKSLPQGSPASPILSNIISYKLDLRLSALANKLDVSYTRYADDISFSGYKELPKYLPLIKKIINNEGFILNDEKQRILYKHNSQIVTGLLVNQKVNVTKKMRKELRKNLFYMRKFGIKEHMHQNGIENRQNYLAHLKGIINFIYMVNPELGNSYYMQLNHILVTDKNHITKTWN